MLLYRGERKSHDATRRNFIIYVSKSVFDCEPMVESVASCFLLFTEKKWCRGITFDYETPCVVVQLNNATTLVIGMFALSVVELGTVRLQQRTRTISCDKNALIMENSAQRTGI